MLKRQHGGRRQSSLVERHFVMQEERPLRLGTVAIEALDPFLRSLLFTDGTVTRALGVQLLAPVAVERLDQAPVAMPAAVAGCLEAPVEEESIRRRVSIGVGAPATPVLWAESFMLPERLPPGFFGLLDGAPDGIGQSLQRVSLESNRELCWFGLDAVPEWVPAGATAATATLHRLYRIVSDGMPAILISEYFAVARVGDTYRLAGVPGDQAGVDDRGGAG
jgi:chorismate-pyruvate lyase